MPRKKIKEGDDFVPFVQRPIFQDTDTFTISSKELLLFTEFAQYCAEFLPVYESMINRFINDGKVQILYETKTGIRLTKEDIEQNIKNAQKQIEKINLPPIE